MSAAGGASLASTGASGSAGAVSGSAGTAGTSGAAGGGGASGAAGAGGSIVDAGDDRPRGDASSSDVRADAVFVVDDASAGCNDVVNTAPVFDGRRVALGIPTPSGGTIVEGTYYETDYTIYTGPGGATGPEGMDHQITAVIAGPIVRIAYLMNGIQKRYTFTMTTSGTQTTWTFSCPPTQAPIVYGFDASPARIVLYITIDPTNQRTFTLTRQ